MVDAMPLLQGCAESRDLSFGLRVCIVRHNEFHIEVMIIAMTMAHVRVAERIKIQAADTLATMGLSHSDAVPVFLMRVVAELTRHLHQHG